MPREFEDKVDVTYGEPYDSDLPGSRSKADSAVEGNREDSCRLRAFLSEIT
jgi:hypothetical protein